MGKDWTSSLILMAGWVKRQGFELDIMFPTFATIPLGRGIVTDPFELKILVKEAPSLVLEAGTNVPAQGQTKPLCFMIELALNEIGASATG